MRTELSYDDLTTSARTVIDRALEQAARRAAARVTPEHLLLALLDVKGNLALKALAALHLDLKRLDQVVVGSLPPEQSAPGTSPQIGADAQQVIRAAFKEAAHLGHYRVDALHLLMGLLYENEGPAHAVLNEAGVSLYELRQYVLAAPKRFTTRSRDELRTVVRPSPVFLVLLGVMFATGVALWWGVAERLVGPFTTVFVLSGWIASVCVHEFGHALSAHLGGDKSVAGAGYLTLNPLKYTHPLFSIVLPVIYLFIGGMGLPGGAVYIRPDALRSRGWEVLTAAAGPLGTLIFCLLMGCPFFLDWSAWVTAENYYFWPALAFLVFLQVIGLVFNLLPVPPLDGFNIIGPSLPREVRQQALLAGNVLFFLLLILLWQDSPLTHAFWQAVYHTANALHVPLELAFEGRNQFAWWQTGW